MIDYAVPDDGINVRCYRKLIELEKQMNILFKKSNQGDDK